IDALSRKYVRFYRGGVALDRRNLFSLSVAEQRRLLRRIAGFDLLTFEAVENLRRWMAAPPSNGRTWQLKKGWVIERLRRSPRKNSATVYWFHQIPVLKSFRKKKDASPS